MKLAIVQTQKNPEDFKDDASMLGILCLATYLKQNGYKDIKLINLSFDNPLHEIKKFKADIVGISSVTNTQNTATKLAESIKNEFDIPVILGGVHVSTLPESLPKFFDAGVVGEGEQTLLNIMEEFERSGNVKGQNINGLVYYDNDKLILTEKRKLITPIDTLPLVDRTFLSEEYYKPQPDWSGKRIIKASIMTSRGCPYNCRFCVATRFWGTVRFFSPEYVINEIENLYKNYKIEMLNIIDSTFMVSSQRIKRMIELMKEKDILDKIKLNINTRTDTINDESCKLLKEFGVDIINFGFESGSERMIRWLKRDTITVEQNKKAVETAVRNGFKVFGSLMLGSPTETIEDMKKTVEFIDWLNEYNAENVWFFVATPYPKTEFWDIAKERGTVSDNMNWDKLQLIDFNNPMLLDKEVDRKEFINLVNTAIEKKTKYFGFKNKMWKSRSLMQNIKSLFSKTETPVSKSKLIFGILKNNLSRKFYKSEN